MQKILSSPPSCADLEHVFLGCKDMKLKQQTKDIVPCLVLVFFVGSPINIIQLNQITCGKRCIELKVVQRGASSFPSLFAAHCTSLAKT